MFQKASTSTLGRRGGGGTKNLKQRKRRLKKKPPKYRELKNRLSKILNLTEWAGQQIEMTLEGISEPKDIIIEII